MLPAFKQCVEELFARGLCKVVFATETLALGINMPARTVVIEKLTKWNGETHADITPGEYTQLTGRAGRRGLDVEGHGVVLWQPGMNPERARRPGLDPHLPAALVVPPVVQHGGQPGAPVRPGDARASCWSSPSPSSRPTRPSSGWPASCARPRRRSTATPRPRPATSATSWSTPRCAGGSPTSRRAPAGPARPTGARRSSSRCARCKPGDVIQVPTGKFAGYAVVDRPRLVRRTSPRPYVVTADRQARRLAMIDFPVAGRGAGPGEGAEDLQRPQPADAPRPGLARCARAPTTSPRRRAGGAGAARAAPAQPGSRRGDRPGCATSCARTPATPARTARTTPAGPSAASSSSRDADDPAAPGRAAHQHRRPPVRPGLRGAHRAGLPRRRRGDRPRGPAPDADLHRARPGRGRVRCGTGCGTT